MTSAIRDFNSTYLRAVWTLHSSLSLFLACNRKYVEFCDSLCVSCRFIERSSQRGDFGENVAFQTIQYRVQSHRHVLAAALHQSLENKGDNKVKRSFLGYPFLLYIGQIYLIIYVIFIIYNIKIYIHTYIFLIYILYYIS